MPKYDYRCSAGHQYEKREGFDAPAVQECQVCGVQARRVLTPPAIVFKGSGWYVTDSRGSRSGATDTPSAASTDGATADAPAKSESSAESSKSSGESSSTAPAAAD